MANVTPGYTWASGNTVTATLLNQAVDDATVTNIVNADIDNNAAIALSKLATGALPTAITVASANLVDGTIVNADINASAAIAGSKLADGGITAAKLDGAQTGSAPIYGCRAWVNFNGTRNATDTGASTNGANVHIRASGNVASVLKNATGDYTITFTTAMPDANYAITASCSPLNDPTACRVVMAKSAATYLAGSVTVKTAQETVGAADQNNVNVAIFR